MKKILSFGALTALLVFLGAACAKPEQRTAAKPARQLTSVPFLVSTEDPLKYCNGDDMDSEGFRKTITDKRTATVAKSPLSETETVVAAIKAAATEKCGTIIENVGAGITVEDGVVSIPPVEGWAGVSIALCACKPLFEVNALNIPGVKQVVWE